MEQPNTQKKKIKQRLSLWGLKTWQSSLERKAAFRQGIWTE